MAKDNWDKLVAPNLDPKKVQEFENRQHGTLGGIDPIKPVAEAIMSDKGQSGGGDDPTKNLPMIVRDQLQKEYPGAQITDQMVNYVVAQLNAKGMTAANTSAPNYRKAVSQFVGATPWAQQQNPFGGGSAQGVINADQWKQMLALTKQFQQPYMDAMNAVSGQMSKELGQVIPGLPAPFKAIAQQEAPIYANLGKQMTNALGMADPGLILNAYAKYMQPQAAGPTLQGLQGAFPGLLKSS